MYRHKKLQSAVELLSTYSFVIVLISLALIIVFYIAAPIPSSVPAQCNSYGGVNCLQAGYVTSPSSGAANVFIEISNSGSNPANVIGANIVVNSVSYIGACTPTFLTPGSNSICTASVPAVTHLGEQMNGKFLINVELCNSGVSDFAIGSCAFTAASYAGEFIAYATYGTTP